MTALPLPPTAPPVSSTLVVPDLPDDVDAMTAALAYAAGGIMVGPIRQQSKHPGSVLGNSWQTQTSTDPKQIVAWMAGDDLGVYLHALGMVIFDVDKPSAVPDWMWPHLDAMPFQRSRRGGDPRKGHYLSACPPGRQFGNGLGRLPKGWGEIRGLAGIVVAAPTRHEFAAEDGCYHWVRTGPVPVLVDEIADLLPEAGPGERVATSAEVEAFLIAHATARKPHLEEAPTGSFANKVAAGGSRHEEAVAACCWIARDSAAGLFSAQTAFQRLYDVFGALIGSDRPALPEFRRIVRWSIGQLTPERVAEVAAKHTEPMASVTQLPTGTKPTVAQLLGPTSPAADGAAVAGDETAEATIETYIATPAAAWAAEEEVMQADDAEIQRRLIEHEARVELRKMRVRERALELKAEEEASDQDFTDRFYDVSELDRLPVPEPLIDGVLNQHTYVVLRGRDGSYKSFTALDWALCLATGTPWLGRAVVPTRVMWLAGEGAYGTRKRILAWEQARGIKIPAGALTLRSGAVNFFRGGPAVDDFVHRVRTGGYGFVVLDTLRTISGGADGNASKDMGDVVDMIKLTREAAEDGTVLVVAHTDKADNDTRGASNIEDDADGVWYAKPDDDGGSLLTLKCTKVKDGAGGLTLELRMRVIELEHLARADGRPETSLVIEQAASVTKVAAPESVNQQKVLNAVIESSATGLTEKAIGEYLGMAKSSTNRALNSLAKSGQIIKRGAFWFPPRPVVESRTGREEAS